LCEEKYLAGEYSIADIATFLSPRYSGKDGLEQFSQRTTLVRRDRREDGGEARNAVPS